MYNQPKPLTLERVSGDITVFGDVNAFVAYVRRCGAGILCRFGSEFGLPEGDSKIAPRQDLPFHCDHKSHTQCFFNHCFNARDENFVLMRLTDGRGKVLDPVQVLAAAGDPVTRMTWYTPYRSRNDFYFQRDRVYSSRRIKHRWRRNKVYRSQRNVKHRGLREHRANAEALALEKELGVRLVRRRRAVVVDYNATSWDAPLRSSLPCWKRVRRTQWRNK